MAYRYKLREEEAETTPSNREQVNYDIVVTPNSVSVEDTVKALETLDNYGMYVSNMRNKSSIQKAIEDHFGPVIPAKRKKMEKDQGFSFPIKTKTSIDDFVKSLTSRPTLLKYKVKDDTIVFPKSGNPAKDLTKKIIDVVMKNAKVDYSIVDKEAVDESTDKLDQEAKLYFMQQFKAGKIKELPKDPKAEYMKVKMTKKELKEVIREQIKNLIK
jgi:ribosomal protein L23